MHASPPPYSPPPTRSTTSKTWMIVLGLLVFMLAVCGGLGAYGFGKVKEMTKHDPKPISGFGKPRVVKKLKEGWATYALKDLGLVADFPSAPAPTDMVWTAEQRMFVKAWAYYEIQTDIASVELDATEYILDIVYTREELAGMLFDSFKEIHPSVTQELQNVTIAEGPALKQRLEFKVEGESFITEAYHLLKGTRAIGIRFGYPLSTAPDVHPEIDRILKSMRFEK